MSAISGCSKQDYPVLFVIGVAAETQTGTAAHAACGNPDASYQDYPGVRVLKDSNGALVLCRSRSNHMSLLECLYGEVGRSEKFR